MKLRYYQQECVDAVLKSFKEYDRVLVSMATGAGKMICMAFLAQDFLKRGKRVLILAHTEKLVEQSVEKLRSAVGVEASVEKAARHADRSSNMVVACVPTMQRDRLLSWPENHFDLVIPDEAHHCFPYYTIILTDIGLMPIGHIVKNKIQANIASLDVKSMQVQWKPIQNWFENKKDILYIIEHEHGEFRCTGNHKVWTEWGYVRAQDIAPGMQLQVLRHAIPAGKGFPQKEDILQQVMSGEMGDFKSGYCGRAAKSGDRG